MRNLGNLNGFDGEPAIQNHNINGHYNCTHRFCANSTKS